jgi:hypothetical protein
VVRDGHRPEFDLAYRTTRADYERSIAGTIDSQRWRCTPDTFALSSQNLESGWDSIELGCVRGSIGREEYELRRPNRVGRPEQQ